MSQELILQHVQVRFLQKCSSLKKAVGFMIWKVEIDLRFVTADPFDSPVYLNRLCSQHSFPERQIEREGERKEREREYMYLKDTYIFLTNKEVLWNKWNCVSFLFYH